MSSCTFCEEKWMCYEEHKLHIVRDDKGKPIKMLGDFVLEKNEGVRCVKDISFPDDNGGHYPLHRPSAKFE